MPTYFRGWRRKIGVLTLVVACVFMGLWLRGQATCDSVIFAGRGSHWNVQFSNLVMGGHGVLFVHRRTGDTMTAPQTGWSSTVNDSTPQKIRELGQGRDQFINSNIAKSGGWWQRRFCGVMIGGANSLEQFWISYRSIVIPLTLLSAYLLFSKPRPPKST